MYYWKLHVKNMGTPKTTTKQRKKNRKRICPQVKNDNQNGKLNKPYAAIIILLNYTTKDNLFKDQDFLSSNDSQQLSLRKPSKNTERI